MQSLLLGFDCWTRLVEMALVFIIFPFVFNIVSSFAIQSSPTKDGNGVVSLDEFEKFVANTTTTNRNFAARPQQRPHSPHTAKSSAAKKTAAPRRTATPKPSATKDDSASAAPAPRALRSPWRGNERLLAMADSALSDGGSLDAELDLDMV
jgi:hypothetical protein